MTKTLGPSALSDVIWKPTIHELSTMMERIEELADWAEGEEFGAVRDKLRESCGPLSNAIEAAAQYAVGVLPEPRPFSPLEFPCRDCGAAENHPCAQDAGSTDRVQQSGLMTISHGNAMVHRLRRTDASDASSKRLRDGLNAANQYRQDCT